MAIVHLLLLALITLLTVLWYVLRRTTTYWKDRGVPYDEPSFFYGNLKGVGETRHFFEALRVVYANNKGKAPFSGLYFFMKPAALIMDLDLVKNVLIKDFNNFTDRGIFVNERDDPLTGHLFALDGQKWRDLRHKLSPTFTSGKMKFMFPTVVEVASRFGVAFSDMVQEDSVVEIKELLARFTTDVIGSCAFGIECNSLKDPNAEFRLMGQRIFNTRRHGMILSAFIRGCPKMAAKLRMKIFSDKTTNFFLRVVEETVEHREKNGIKRNDFLDMLIELKNKKESRMTINEMAAQMFVFFLAGFETSSTTMGFCLYELAQNHEIQDKVRTEILATLSDTNGELTYECSKAMPYLDQVINETLRKYAVVPGLTRMALNDYKVPNSDLVIEKDTLIVIPADAIHHDPENYPDPSKFDPERFSPEEIQKRHPCAWLPFGDGPRNCIGLRFGQMQARIGLVELLSKFKFSVSDKTEFPIQINPRSGLMGSKNGIYLKVDRI